jgi:hypothetical protein
MTDRDRAPTAMRPPPVAPGTSPYRAKGLMYRALTTYADATVPGGWQAVVASLPADLARFAAQPFLAGGWYDFLPVVSLTVRAAELAGTPHDAWLTAASRAAAAEQARGLYRFLLSFVSDEKIALWMPQLTARYFDFGTLRAERVSPGHVRTVRVGTPAFCAHWYRVCGAEYVLAAIDLARGTTGSARVASRVTATERDPASGLPVVTIEFDCWLR